MRLLGKWLRSLCVLLAFAVFFSGADAFRLDAQAKKSKTKTEKASDEDEEEEEKTPEELAAEKLKKEKKARKKIPIETNAIEGWPQGPKSYCQSGILLDLDSGATLYSKNADEKLYPASITKVLTALVAIENCELDEKVTFSQDSIDILGNDYANIGMKAGETITMEDALYAMLLASANEVAYAICEHFGGGDYSAGVAMLNAKAQELGCTNSNFVNPNGIFDENHYTTASDMARIAQAAYRSDLFRKIVSTKQYTIGKTKKTKEERTFQNHHKMLWQDSDYYYAYCTGGKTGYTSEALNTLVTFAEKDGRRLLCVTLKTQGKDTYKDTKKILNYGFSNFQTLSISENETTTDYAKICDGTYVTIPVGASFSDLTYTAQTEGAVAYLYYTWNGQAVGCGVAEVTSGSGAEGSAAVDTGEASARTANAGTTAGTAAGDDDADGAGAILFGIRDKKLLCVAAAAAALLFLLLFLRIRLALKRRKKRKRRRKRRGRKRR